MMTHTARRISGLLQLTVAAILLQTLFFKFTGAEESVYIFSRLGVEPWGRVGAGVAELMVAVLLLTPRFAALGALGALGVITGAIMSHLMILGIEIQGDGGMLFGLAIGVFGASLAIVVLRRDELRLMSGVLAAQEAKP